MVDKHNTPHRLILIPAHIYVALGGTIITSSNYSIEGTTLTFTTAPVTGTLIRIGRKTSQEARLTDYQDASLLTADALDRDANQLFYMAQEAIDTASETNVAASTFYSASTTPPDTAYLGDLWYDAANKYLKIYNGTQWDLATPSNETFTYESDVFDNTEAGLTYINVANLNLDVFVFLNGVKQVRADSKADLTAVSGAKDFFIDLDNSRVYFAQLSTNDIVQVILAASDIGTNNHTQLETYTATDNQTVFTLTNSYIPTTNTLSVYVNGVRQSAYTETNATTVTFTNGLTAGDEVVFITNQYQTAQGFTAADNVTYTPVGSSNASTAKAALDSLNSAVASIPSTLVHSTDVITTSIQSLTANTPTEITGLSVTLTPQSVNSKFFLTANWSGELETASINTVFGFKRDIAYIGNPAAAGNRAVGRGVLAQGWHQESSTTPDVWSGQYVDTPNTTDEITYKVFIRTTTDQTLYNNRTEIDGDDSHYERVTSSLIILEIP